MKSAMRGNSLFSSPTARDPTCEGSR
jgi:hypothetical protein